MMIHFHSYLQELQSMIFFYKASNDERAFVFGFKLSGRRLWFSVAYSASRLHFAGSPLEFDLTSRLFKQLSFPPLAGLTILPSFHFSNLLHLGGCLDPPARTGRMSQLPWTHHRPLVRRSSPSPLDVGTPLPANPRSPPIRVVCSAAYACMIHWICASLSTPLGDPLF